MTLGARPQELEVTPSYLCSLSLSARSLLRLNMVDVFSTRGTLKPVKIILRRGRGKRENNGGGEPNQGALYARMEMTQQNPLYKEGFFKKDHFWGRGTGGRNGPNNVCTYE
jgi:hypothetical protein